MSKTTRVPWFVLMANVLTKTLLRAGVKLMGFGKVPTYLLTVRGRKSGQPRTTPISIVEQDGKRYLFAPFGVVDWVRNLRAAGEATLTRGRRVEKIYAIEVPGTEASLILKRFIATDNPMGHYFGVTKESSQEDFDRAAASHPVFLLQRTPSTNSEAARQAHLTR